jgi:hypothetical protein
MEGRMPGKPLIRMPLITMHRKSQVVLMKGYSYFIRFSLYKAFSSENLHPRESQIHGASYLEQGQVEVYESSLVLKTKVH